MIRKRLMTLHRLGSAQETHVPDKFAGLAADARLIGCDLSVFVMGDPDATDAPAAIVLRIPPGVRFPRHTHPCERFEVVVEGSMITTEGVVLGPGDVMVASEGEMYGPNVAGPD